jgi:hypothetical protein
LGTIREGEQKLNIMKRCTGSKTSTNSI